MLVAARERSGGRSKLFKLSGGLELKLIEKESFWRGRFMSTKPLVWLFCISV
jgi:hypothetical protein